MRRFLCCLLLAATLLAGTIQPAFAVGGDEPAAETTAPQTEPEQSQPPVEAEAALPAAEEPQENKTVPQSFVTSAEGIAFVNEMMGGSYGGTAQLAAAEQSVNDFIARYDLTLIVETLGAAGARCFFQHPAEHSLDYFCR